MQKVAAAVIKQEDKILLARRANSQPFAGFWELPGGKAEQGERTSAALKRELSEELAIDATIGKLITSVQSGQYEIFAYNIEKYNGDIKLSVHDKIEWVPLKETLSYALLPADRKIIMHMSNEKRKSPESKSNFESIIAQKISKPVFNEKLKKWEVYVHGAKSLKSFDSKILAIDFYVQEARKILGVPQLDIQKQY